MNLFALDERDSKNQGKNLWNMTAKIQFYNVACSYTKKIVFLCKKYFYVYFIEN